MSHLTRLRIHGNHVDVTAMDPFLRECLNPAGDPAAVADLIEKGANVNSIDDKGNTALLLVLGTDRPSGAIVRKLLEDGASADATYEDCTMIPNKYHKSTALHFASKRRDYTGVDVVRLLLQHGANANAVNLMGRTPLHEVGDEFTIKLLLDADAKINAKDTEGRTPLHEACTCGYESSLNGITIKALLEAGANVNAKDDDECTPLHQACTNGGSESILRILLEAGANANAKDEYGITPLISCLFPEQRYGRCNLFMETPALAPVLIDAGADLSATISLHSEEGEEVRVVDCVDYAVKVWLGEDPGSAAYNLGMARQFLSEIVPALNRRGLGIDHGVVGGKLALRVMSGFDADSTEEDIFADHMDKLIEFGADLTYVDSETGFTAVHHTIFNNLMDDFVGYFEDEEGGLDDYVVRNIQGLYDRCITAGRQLNLSAATTRKGLTPLHCAVRKRHTKTIRKLVELGADVTARTKINGWTPLHLAAFDPTTSTGETDESYEEEYGERGKPLDLQVFKTLVDCGCAVGAVTRQCGGTVLHLLCKSNHTMHPTERISVIKWILEQDDINPTAFDRSGKTALQWAGLKNQPPEIIHLLLARDPTSLVNRQAAASDESAAKRSKVTSD